MFHRLSTQREKGKLQSKHFFLVLIFALLSACVKIGTEQPHRPVSKTGTAGQFVVTIWASDGCPDTGATVTLRATVANETQQTQIVELRDEPVLDIIVGIPHRSTIRWSAGKALTSDLTRLELGPGESKTIEMEWKMQWEGQNRPFIYARFIRSALATNDPIYATVWTGETCGMY